MSIWEVINREEHHSYRRNPYFRNATLLGWQMHTCSCGRKINIQSLYSLEMPPNYRRNKEKMLGPNPSVLLTEFSSYTMSSELQRKAVHLTHGGMNMTLSTVFRLGRIIPVFSLMNFHIRRLKSPGKKKMLVSHSYNVHNVQEGGVSTKFFWEVKTCNQRTSGPYLVAHTSDVSVRQDQWKPSQWASLSKSRSWTIAEIEVRLRGDST